MQKEDSSDWSVLARLVDPTSNLYVLGATALMIADGISHHLARNRAIGESARGPMCYAGVVACADRLRFHHRLYGEYRDEGARAFLISVSSMERNQ